MTAARAGHAAALLPDGRVLVAGGIGLEPGGGQRSLASAEVYDPVTGMFTRTGPMVADRACCLGRGLAATVLPDGRVLVSGGGQFTSSTQGVCCDGGKTLVYVGIEEKGAPALRFNPAPKGKARLPDEVQDDRIGPGSKGFLSQLRVVQRQGQ